MEDIRDKLKKNRLKIVFLLAFIFSLVGAILLLAFNFAEYYDTYVYWDSGLNSYVYEYTYGEVSISTDIYGPLIALSGTFLLITTFISLVGMYNPKFVNNKTIALGLILAFIVFLLAAIGTVIASSELGDYSDWWVEAGFYGGLLGGIFTFIFFGLNFLFMKRGSFQEPKQVSVLKSKVSSRVAPVKTVQKVSYCHNCGKEVSGEFCTYCGTELRKIQEYKLPESEVSKVNLCPKCGKDVSGEFCTYCGAKLR